MKYFVLGLGMCLFTNLLAQSSIESCYDSYLKVFENRGASKVVDGTHDDVIISVRSNGQAECYLGKVHVKGGEITQMFMKFEDKSYEKFNVKWKKAYPITIHNGVSRTQVTTDDEKVNVMFTKSIKPKKKKYQRAPVPKFDLN